MKSTFRIELFPAIVATSLLMSAQAGKAMVHEPADVEAVLATHAGILEALSENDADGFSELTSEDLRVLAPGGRLEDKAMVLEGLGTVKGKLHFSEEEVTVIGDTAIMTGKIQSDAVMEPFGKLPPMKYIATFVRTDEGWRMLSRAMTPCARVAIERGVC